MRARISASSLTLRTVVVCAPTVPVASPG
jgi:hypothetical protein